ncbi:hypothetical protein BXP70_08360 [Hymenobacter crusticola]|uniref:Uncharacterized protein n=1 Tax=Hymenobacter crusticola TaxID=1770526 RepID=A0A243WG77_9BACT|nr:hypothetical protein BXP70_08360 [Hymenobacter crusticola]
MEAVYCARTTRVHTFLPLFMPSFEIGDLVRLKADDSGELLQVMLIDPTVEKSIKCLPYAQLHQGLRGFLSFSDHYPDELEPGMLPGN